MNMCTRQAAFIGPKNQEKISNATVAIIGVGALGSAVAHLLTRMGVTSFILLDDDIVADHNLGRQHMYTQEDIGEKKVLALSKRLLQIQDVSIKAHSTYVDISNLSLLDGANILVDGTDNHATRRLIDSYAKEHHLAWVHGAAIEDKGTVIYFPQDLSYGDIYYENAKDQNCELVGVLATATTLVASMQAQMVLMHLMGEDIPRRMYRLSGLEWSSFELK